MVTGCVEVALLHGYLSEYAHTYREYGSEISLLVLAASGWSTEPV